MIPDDLISLAARVVAALSERKLSMAAGESCTGGLVAACVTAIAGSSAVFERGFVTYSNQAKTELLGVPPALLATHGAVSAEVAEAMAAGVLAHAQADIALSITGIAGPSGATPTKPVGLVFLGCGGRDGPVQVERHVFPGNRTAVRLAAVRRGLEMVLRAAAAG